MSSLRARMNTMRLVLVAATFCALAAADMQRSPENQAGARAWIATVHAYQGIGRPVVRRFVQCRYVPTCSQYSIEAVEKYGAVRGLTLTARRVFSCTGSVPAGTQDPVP